MKKKFRTGFVILIVICVLAAGLYTAGRVCWNYAKLRLSQYIDKQVAQEVEQIATESQSYLPASGTESESVSETKFESNGETETESIDETESNAVEANGPVREEEISNFSAELILPKVFYFRKTDEDQQYNIYYKNITAGEYDIFELVSQNGTQLSDCYRFQTSEVNNNLFDVVMRLFSNGNEVLASQGVIFNFVEPQSDDEINLLCIGDSWTEMGEYCGRIQEQMDHLNLVGVMEKPGENLPRIGHGGWSLFNYMNNFMTDLDSPFLFPIGVAGSQYRGCVQTMKNIVTCDDSAYNVALYKKYARGWKDEGDFLWDEEGYYKEPLQGDVMTDNQRPEGERYIQWDGSQWVPMEQQPEGYEYNFSKFMERFAACFDGKKPTHVSILTGANDFTYGCNPAEVMEWMDDFLEPMIQSIHEYDPEICVMIAACQLGADQDAFGRTFGSWITSRQYNDSMKTMLKEVLRNYDNDEHKARNIYVVPIYAMLDTENGFATVVEQADSYSDETVERHTDALHPNEVGMNQVGDAFLGILELTR